MNSASFSFDALNRPAIQGQLIIFPSSQFIFERAKVISEHLKNALEDSKEFHEHRSQLYVYLQNLQHQPIPPIFNNDQCLSKAEKIAKSLLFNNHPGSQNRLVPLATNYIKSFHILQGCLQKESSYDAHSFISAVNALIKDHTAFAVMYCSEMKEVYKTLPDMVKITHKEDIRFFIEAYLNSLGKPTLKELNYQVEKVQEGETSLVFSFYILALEHALRTEKLPLPQLFTTFQKEFQSLEEAYKKLNQREQEGIFSCLVGVEEELSHKAKKVLEMIQTSAYHWQRDPKQNKLYSSLLSIIYPEVSKSLCLMRQIKFTLDDLQENHLFSSQHMCRVIFYSGLLLSNEEDDLFDFFKQEEISALREEYKQMSQEDKTKVKWAVVTKNPLNFEPKLKEFMIEIAYFAYKLEPLDQQLLLSHIFKLAL